MLLLFVFDVFFFFKQKTAYEMRISDWSSDVCSSDLRPVSRRCAAGRGRADPGRKLGRGLAGDVPAGPDGHTASAHRGLCQLRRPVRRDRRISRPLATAFPDAVGKAWCILRSPRDPVMDAGPAEDGSPRSRRRPLRSEEHTSELQSLMRMSYSVFCLKKKNAITEDHHT